MNHARGLMSMAVASQPSRIASSGMAPHPPNGSSPFGACPYTFLMHRIPRRLLHRKRLLNQPRSVFHGNLFSTTDFTDSHRYPILSAPICVICDCPASSETSAHLTLVRSSGQAFQTCIMADPGCDFLEVLVRLGDSVGVRSEGAIGRFQKKHRLARLLRERH